MGGTTAITGNGIHVSCERMPAVETVTLGIWLPRGSRHEPRDLGGMFHFIEHTLFKGTPSRNARAIAEATDAVGGVLDAYTAKEETCYSFKVRAKHLSTMFEILADMLHNPLFDEEELARERSVILEEIKMEEDNPEDVAYEHNLGALWPEHPIGRPILGRAEDVACFDRARTAAFHQGFYREQGLVVSAAGNCDHDEIAALVERWFPGRRAIPVGDPDALSTPVAQASQTFLARRHFEQVNFCLSFPALAYTDPDRDALYLLNTALGGAASSRLFQRIREERGLAYSIGSYTNLFSDCGALTIYGGCSPENLETVIELALAEVVDLAEHGLDNDEFARAREQLIGSTLMGLETTGSRAGVMARELMLTGTRFDLAETVAALEAVSRTRVRDLAEQIFRDESLTLTAVGRLPASGPRQPFTLRKPAVLGG